MVELCHASLLSTFLSMRTTPCVAGLHGLCEIVLRAPHILRAFHNLQNIFPDIISLHCHSHSVGLV